MLGEITDEFESLLLDKTKLSPSTSGSKICYDDASNPCDDDGFMGDGSYEESNISDLNGEWERRRKEFHNIGYRDGVMAGKQDSAQEGFNLGLQQSVLVGYKWGLVRGVTSAMANLPAGVKEKLMETPSNTEKLHRLYESVQALSTSDHGLELFRDYIVTLKSENENPNFNASHFKKYFLELQTLLSESPKIQVNLSVAQGHHT